ncbi:MAG: 50S ribosomal protein L29 [Anaerolineae bacterium]|nr:50S ribosomal protein L29 [Anaerolineae bacterium]
MDMDELRNLDEEELAYRLNNVKEELFNLRFQKSIGQLEDYNRLRELKRNVARIKTVQSQRRLAARIAEEEQGNAQ